MINSIRGDMKDSVTSIIKAATPLVLFVFAGGLTIVSAFNPDIAESKLGMVKDVVITFATIGGTLSTPFGSSNNSQKNTEIETDSISVTNQMKEQL